MGYCAGPLYHIADKVQCIIEHLGRDKRRFRLLLFKKSFSIKIIGKKMENFSHEGTKSK